MTLTELTTRAPFTIYSDEELFLDTRFILRFSLLFAFFFTAVCILFLSLFSFYLSCAYGAVVSAALL